MRAWIETRRVGSIALVLGAALIWGPLPASAETITLGQLAPPGSTGTGNTVTYQVSSGPSSPAYTVPAGSWTITSWSVRGGTLTSTARIQVWRPTATPGQQMLLAQSSALATVPPGGVGPFSTSIAVQGGDLLGLRVGSGNIDDLDVGSAVTGDVARKVSPPGSDPTTGQTVGPDGSDYAYTELGGRVEYRRDALAPDHANHRNRPAGRRPQEVQEEARPQAQEVPKAGAAVACLARRRFGTQ